MDPAEETDSVATVGRMDETPEDGRMKSNLVAQVSGSSPYDDVLLLMKNRTRRERKHTS